eukprot:TRINITY_DN68380_c0_g1_i1.p1 TRINITY_DN68380_c0_g1~~TRINITY_DN68380_c0_g1_i1.p1  ORF type:complete len:316 (-),score=17.85 TRINITY_DN68380_c0_g1_i1:60-1007(-)
MLRIRQPKSSSLLSGTRNKVLFVLLSLILILSAVRVLGLVAISSDMRHHGDSGKPPAEQQEAKLGFIFLTRGNHNQGKLWETYLANNMHKVAIKVHPKHPDAISQSFLVPNIIDDRVDTAWGEVGLIRATLNLLKEVFRDPNVNMAVLLSEACIPIKPFEFVYNKLAQSEKSWFIWQDADHMLPEFMERRVETIPKAMWMHHAQWMAITRKHAELVLEFSSEYLPMFRGSFTSDEHFFLTVLNLVGVDVQSEVQDRCVTFTNWRDSAEKGIHPVTYTNLTVADVQKFRASECLFARKFSVESDVGVHWNEILSQI